jgi:ABC-type nitrate/sulfonate/bicarbonate transport system substrate-binding protein
VVPAGTGAERLALLRTGQADSMITDFTLATKLAKRHEARIAFDFGNIVPVFHTHMIFATDKLIKEHPDQVKAFLAGWFETIATMQKDKKATVPVLMDVLKLDNDVASQAWDKLMSMFSTDGKFDQKALAVLSTSFVDLGLLPSAPKDMSALYTEAYLPKK